jgi:hypothetical protein
MTQAKIQIAVGSISFSGEGEQKWLAEQLDKLLDKAAALAAAAPDAQDADEDGASDGVKPSRKSAGTLPSFLAATGAGNNNVKRFLATAEWLHRKGKKTLTTRDVSTALQDNRQKKLGNPADSLSKNVAKGHCEKIGSKEFFVTDEGRETLNA